METFSDNLIQNDTPELKTINKRQFGVNKGVVSRAVVKFSGPPKEYPNTACFHFPNTFLTHKYILEMVRSTLNKTTLKIIALQFVDRNTLHGTQNMENRWLITFSKEENMNSLISKGLTLFNKNIFVFSYNNVLKEEYQEFITYQELKDLLFIKPGPPGI